MPYLESTLKTSGYARETAKHNRIKARQLKEIRRYFKTVEIRLLEGRPTTLEEFDTAYRQNKRIRGNGTTYYSFARHNYTNYDEICAYVSNRWRLFNKQMALEILHPRVRMVVGPYLQLLKVEAGMLD